MTTSIQWTDETWNPVTGCTKVSAGCKNCYAEKVADRFWGDRKFTDVRTHAERLEAPLRWRKPRRVFVNSMSDLFHEDVPDEFIDHVFAVMAQARKHTFQVLTKRPDRMRVFMLRWPVGSAVAALPRIPSYTEMTKDDLIDVRHTFWPLPNVWLGVSVEDQKAADERIPLLLDTPAAVRFLSCEPLLGPVDLRRWMAHVASYVPDAPSPSGKVQVRCTICGRITPGMERECRTMAMVSRPIDWIIVGGESGPRARPCNIAWIRSIVEQCKAADVAVFVKQLGASPHDRNVEELLLNDGKGGDPSEWPEDIRVRQFPEEK